MSTVTPRRKMNELPSNQGGRPARQPGPRNCAIYERIRIEGETHERVAADYALSRQRVFAIAAQVENWLAAHARHPLAQKMRFRCGKRWDTLWTWAIDSFDRSRQSRETKKERTARRAATGGGADLLTTISEQTVREQNGDPRFLNIAWRVAEREDRLWLPPQSVARSSRSVAAVEPPRAETSESPLPLDADGCPPPQVRSASARFPYLPAALCDLEHLACGLRNATEGVPYRSHSAEGVAHTPVSTLFEQRCAEAFRCLGFEVRELGQGCGRVADCLAVAAAERFAVIVDAKVRRRGYTLGTDDRQFCEYATRHTRELQQSGVERVYFAVVGRGFRHADLEKLAGFMTGTPIRGVVFIEVEALMRLVNDSIGRRRDFRLAEIDQLLFGNKVLEA
ncbi:MAG TPA: hypothetical protein VJ783_18390 [Pirellulales bacterium]|nr:hypothetical protein [Pirellulales bacterium]